ncbi:MAG: TusE/DsrC/DsvC family sulfur relay protein [Verrucomicrobiota bacterium]|nr:TusE/DsrC/DsvC family sulfur relay protein [Limisphaera sp.]MDW8382117.1 TusE/DsrC/DsvC family sulfur relay protein [Verrucomicrobiota bacterium]
MPEKIIAGQTVTVDEEGYLQNPAQWNRDIAQEIASEMGIQLTDAHWKVIEFLRRDYQERGAVPGMRRLNKVAGIAIKDLYTLFPDGPIKKAARIAGCPKPTSCV